MKRKLLKGKIALAPTKHQQQQKKSQMFFEAFRDGTLLYFEETLRLPDDSRMQSLHKKYKYQRRITK